MREDELKLEYLQALRVIDSSISNTEAEAMLEIGFARNRAGLDAVDNAVIGGIVAKYCRLLNGFILNHETYKLSDLDLEMMREVKPGGNYRDIPLEVVKKSKRLSKLVESGGRTTYYGRLAWDKPSYTITTLWNRPGNGTHMMPDSERVLSVREAARLQGFEDTYYFYGNRTHLLKEVGNAVPPLIGYQIGKRIVDVIGSSKSVDLFSGAGGLTHGMYLAGIESVISNDIEKAALITLKINMPQVRVLCDDITKAEVKRELIKTGLENNVQVVCGGPPCQGYSMAGKRDSADKRNRLFEEFVEVVKGIKPKVIVFENVEGLLSYNKGETYREVQAAFKGIGYKIEGRKLLFSDYGVPQKRKRVILIGVREDVGIEPSELYPKPLTEDKPITVKESLYDISREPCGAGAKYREEPSSAISKYYRGEQGIEEYIESLKSR